MPTLKGYFSGVLSEATVTATNTTGDDYRKSIKSKADIKELGSCRDFKRTVASPARGASAAANDDTDDDTPLAHDEGTCHSIHFTGNIDKIKGQLFKKFKRDAFLCGPYGASMFQLYKGNVVFFKFVFIHLFTRQGKRLF